MKRNVLILIAAPVALLIATASAASAQRISDEQIQELIRAAAARAGVSPGGTPTQNATPQARASAQEPATLQVTLDDAIKLALDRNLDIAVQRLNPQTFDYSIASLQATYRPTLTSTIGRQSATNASTQTLAGLPPGTPFDIINNTYTGGLNQSFRKGGGTLVAAFNNNRQLTSSPNAIVNPLYSPQWSATFTQPLLRNFRIDANRRQIVVTRLNQEVSELQLQQTIINTISNVRNAYWDYVFAVQSVEVARRSVALAEQLVKDNQTRVEVGTMAPIDVVQAQAQAATQRQNLATAEGTRRTSELALKRLVVSGTDDPNWSLTLDPTDRPEFTPQPIDIAGAVRRALDSRTDLQVVKKNLEVNNATLRYLDNQTLPQVDLQARYQLAGQGGTILNRAPGQIAGAIISTTPGGYGDALDTLIRGKYPTWNVQVNFSYPLGTSAQEANVARAKVQVNQVRAQVHQIELQIATDVTNAATNVQSNAERVQAAQAARELAQRQLEAEQSKFEVGMSTNYFVVQAQRDLATAQNNELQAVLNYRKSLVEFDRLQQTTLGTSNITIISATGGNGITAIQ